MKPHEKGMCSTPEHDVIGKIAITIKTTVYGSSLATTAVKILPSALQPCISGAKLDLAAQGIKTVTSNMSTWNRMKKKG